MATMQEIHAAMTGFPRILSWHNFRPVQVSPNPPHAARTSVSWSRGPWSVNVVNGNYRVRGARITVALSPHGSWAIPAARSSADLLQHEQGHYDITGLIARDLISNVLDLSMDVTVVAALRDSGNTPQDHVQYVGRRFHRDIDGFDRDATALGAQLQTNPVTHNDGLYDVQTNHGMSADGQRTWNARLQRIKAGNAGFAMSLKIEGVIR